MRACIVRKRDRECRENEDEWAQDPFDLDQLSQRECRKYFRFRKAELGRLQRALKIPEVVETEEEDRRPGIEALYILLRRLAYPNRWLDLLRIFARSEGSLSRVFYHVLFHINSQFQHLLESWDLPWLTEEDFMIYAAAISRKGGVIPTCFGFIDCTVRPIARPRRNQRIIYSGHKRVHCVKWQSVILPNGIITSLYGGERGSIHDSRMFSESRVLQRLCDRMEGFEKKYCLHGDSGYGEDEILRKLFSTAAALIDRRKQLHNKAMSSVRQCVERGFKEVSRKFAFIDFRKQMKLFEKRVYCLYRVAVLLTNYVNCLRPNQTSMYFGLEGPLLEEYLAA